MDRPQRNSTDRWLAVAAGAATLALFLITLDEPTITWDEGATIRRESLVRGWFERVTSPPQGVSRGQLFEEPAISTFWPFAREEPDGHPPFYAVLGNLGWLISHRWLPPLQAHRFGPVLLFCFTTAVMYHFLARRWGRLAGVAAAGSWVLVPRVFAHAHLASYDVPLACLWFLAVVAFWKAREGWVRSFGRGITWSVVFAIMLAMAAATKFTGWLIPIPIFVWSAAAGVIAVRRGGIQIASVVVKLGHLVPCLFLLLLLIPTELRLIRDLVRIESSLTEIPDEDSQHRAARAADVFRAAHPASEPINSCLLFLIAVLWGVAYGMVALVRRFDHRAAPGSRHSISPTAEALFAAVALTPAVVNALVPTFWHEPFRGIAIFLWSNLSRQKTTWIPTQFFGTLYEFSLPWYNTLAWVGLTVPPLVMLLMLLGIVSVVTKWGRIEDRGLRIEDRGRSNAEPVLSAARDPQSSILNPQSLAWLLLLNAATLLVIRALPGAPGHDGERQLLGSFPFLACLAGIGAEWFRVKLMSIIPTIVANWAARALVGVSLAWSATAIWHYRAAPLSYYTELVGGLRGATRLGLEPTYYWDAFDQRGLDWLNQNTRPGEGVLFCNDFAGIQYLRQWGKLRVSQFPHEPGVPKWYVLQNRPGLFAETPWNRWLAEHGELAAFTHELDGVPLIWVFPIEAHDEAFRQTKRATEGR